MNKLLQLQQLFEHKKYREAIPLAEELIEAYPDNAFMHVSLGICYSESGDDKKAVDMFIKARKRFPTDPEIPYYLAEIYNRSGRYPESEKAFREAIELTPVAKQIERSECYNGLGAVLWKLSRREEAIEAWKHAIKENPDNRIAQKNLKEFTNEYKKPASPSKVFDDLYHFQWIQMERYFISKGITSFGTKEEAERVLESIRLAWNKHVALRGTDLDKMTPAEKTEIFKSINVNFIK